MVVREPRQIAWTRWRSGKAALLVWVTLGASACASRPTVVEQPLGGSASAANYAGPPKRNNLDEHALEAVLDRRVDEIMARANVDRAFERLLESVFDDKALSEQGERLMSELADAPEIAARSASIQDRIGELPQMTALVARLMSENPDAEPEKIGALAGVFIERQVDSPAFDQAIERALDEFLEQPALAAVFDAFGRATSDNPQVVRNLSWALRGIDEAKLQQRLRELNGGVEPDEARTSQLLETHAFTADRIERLMLDWVELPETRKVLTSSAEELLRAPAFRRHALQFFAELLSDPAFERGLLSSFALLLEPNVDADLLVREFGRVLKTPRTTATCVKFLNGVLNDPALQAIGDRALGRLSAGPAFAASFQTFATSW